MIRKDKQTIHILRPPKIALSFSLLCLIVLEAMENGLLETCIGI